MPSTTPTYGWSYGVLTDGPVDLLDIGTLAPAIDAQMAGTTVIGVPGSASVTVAESAWTTVCSVSITLPTAQPVEIVAWVYLLNTGTSRPQIALQVLDGSTHLFGTGWAHMGGTSDTSADQWPMTTPRRRVGLTAGSHTINFQVSSDGNGTTSAKKTNTANSQDIAVTGIEVTY